MMLVDEDNFEYGYEGPLPEAKKEDSNKYLSFSPLDEGGVAFLKSKYHLSETDISVAGIKWSNTTNRFVYPCRDLNGRQIAFVSRSEYPDVKPKAVTTVLVPEEPLCSFHVQRPQDNRLWLVEDIISAIRLSSRLNACALLGTHVSDGLLNEIKKGKFDSITVCLDADARESAVKLMERLGGLFGHRALRVPKKDVKNMTPEELQSFLKGE
jgi:hypothetical protein